MSFVQVSSRYATLKNNNALFECTLDQPVFEAKTVQLVRAVVPFTYHVINATNNTLEMKDVVGNYVTYTVPIGNYTASELATTLTSILPDITVTFDSKTGYFTFTKSHAFNISFRFNSFRMAKCCGFEPYSEVDEAGSSLVSVNVVQVTGCPMLNIKTNFALKVDVAGRNNNDVFSIPVTTNPGGVIVAELGDAGNIFEFEYGKRGIIDKILIAIEFADNDAVVGGSHPQGGLNNLDCFFLFRFE